MTRETSITELFPMLRPLAIRVRAMAPGSDLDELIGDGAVGLIRAVDTFDPTRGLPLDRYARRIVVGAMLNGLRKRDPVSERARREIRAAERERFALAQERGEMPSSHEMEQRRSGLRRAREAVAMRVPLSLDGPPAPFMQPPKAGDDPAVLISECFARAQLAEAIAALPTRERTVLHMHYMHGASLRSVGRHLAVSPQRASQLHLAALARLRETVSA